MDIAKRLKKLASHKIEGEIKELEYDMAADEIIKLRKQLPKGMQDCTIVFKECEFGHGKLTATNWVQHECQTCLINSLRAKVASADVLVGALREAKLALLSGVLTYESVRIIEKAIAKYNKLIGVKHD